MKKETKSVDFTDQTCPNVFVTITSNTIDIYNQYTNGFCYIQIITDTSFLVPMTDFILNATLENGTNYIYTQTKLTPRMLSEWVSNA